MFLSFLNFGQHYYKKVKQEKNEKFTRNKFRKVFIKISATYKKHLGHTETTNIQNNCISYLILVLI